MVAPMSGTAGYKPDQSTVKTGPLVLIEWTDSQSMLGGGPWTDAETIVSDLRPSSIRSVGWVLREDKASVTIVAHVSSQQVSGDLCIPKSAIAKRTVLKR